MKPIGWECPSCFRCYAPFCIQCQHCGPQKMPCEQTGGPDRQPSQEAEKIARACQATDERGPCLGPNGHDGQHFTRYRGEYGRYWSWA